VNLGGKTHNFATGITNKDGWKSIQKLKLEYFEYYCQMSSKSILIILSCTISKFARFFLRHIV